MAARWYVLQTHPQQERLAELSLKELGVATFLPMATRRAYIRNLAVEQAQPLFGPYLFAGFDLELDNWRPVNRAKGVVRLLPRHREEPLALPDGVVERWRARMEGGEFRAQDVLGLMVGDLVIVSGGIWRDKAGRFDGISASGALRLIMELLGARSSRRCGPARSRCAAEAASPSGHFFRVGLAPLASIVLQTIFVKQTTIEVHDDGSHSPACLCRIFPPWRHRAAISQ
jgi:transcription antitermination factor NusG